MSMMAMPCGQGDAASGRVVSFRGDSWGKEHRDVSENEAGEPILRGHAQKLAVIRGK